MIKQSRFFDVASDIVDNSGKYTHKILVPQYEPSNKKPLPEELYNTEKYSKLVANIRQSNVSENEKQFLMLAATRHLIFNYSKIADYYAHANKEMQELMEESALVILDIDDAIANGYVKLSERVREIMKIGESECDEE